MRDRSIVEVAAAHFVDAIEQAISEECDASYDAEESQQPGKQRRRVFVSIEDQRDEQDAYPNQEDRQSFVDKFRQSHVRIPSTASRFDRRIILRKH